MDADLIKRLAREAGIDITQDTLCRNEGWREPMEHFAQLVAGECAKLCIEAAPKCGQRDATPYLQMAIDILAKFGVKA